MLNRNLLILTSWIALLSASCNSSPDTPENTNTFSANKLTMLEQRQAIYDLENKLKKATNAPFDPSAALSMVNLYCNYLDNFPNDSVQNPEYLFKCAQIQITLEQAEQAIEKLNRIINQYPNSKRIAEAYYLLAFTYDNTLKDSEKAKQAYQNFIDKFPNHPLAETARASINIAGKSEEELLNFIKSKNK